MESHTKNVDEKAPDKGPNRQTSVESCGEIAGLCASVSNQTEFGNDGDQDQASLGPEQINEVATQPSVEKDWSSQASDCIPKPT